MAALSALPLSMGMRDLEEGAEEAHARQQPSASIDSPTPSTSTQPPHHNHRTEYTAAFFHPRVLFVFVLGCLVPMVYIYLYVGALWSPQSHIHNVHVHIYNLDAGIDRSAVVADYQLNVTGQAALSRLLPTDNVGRLLGSTLLYTSTTAGLFDWQYCDISNCSYSSLAAVQSAVDKGDESAWYTLVIPADYTHQVLNQAFNLRSLTQLNDDIAQLVATNQLPSPLDGSYTNYVYQVFDQGRSYATFSFLSATLTAALNGLSSSLTRTIYSSISELSYGTNLVKAAFLFNPVPVAAVNVHPVSHYGLNFFSYLSGLVLWIGSIVTLTVVIKWSNGVERRFFAAHASTPKALHAGIGIGVRLVLVALINIIQAVLVMSVVPALGGAGVTVYGYGHLFVWLWYSAFCMSLTVGGLLALVGPEVFQLFATLWLILQLTSCGGIIDQVLQPSFYRIGLAFPLYYVVQGNRTILFGSYYHITQDALVLFGSAVGSLLIISVLATRRIDRKWDALRDSALVDALRDTTGFSSTKQDAGIGLAPGPIVERGASKEDVEKEAAVGRSAKTQQVVELQDEPRLTID